MRARAIRSPRIVRAGAVEPLGLRGLALGIEGSQAYEDERVTLEPGDAVVLYTDGLLEARREGELYGEERLDALSRQACLAAAPRSWPWRSSRTAGPSRRRAADDCAVVVLKRT